MRLHPEIAHGDQALAFEPVVRHTGLGGERPRQMPVALGAQRRHDCLPFSRSQGQQVANLGAHLAPLVVSQIISPAVSQAISRQVRPGFPH